MRLLKKIIKASGFKQELTEAHSNLLEAVVRSSAENRRINSFFTTTASFLALLPPILFLRFWHFDRISMLKEMKHS